MRVPRGENERWRQAQGLLPREMLQIWQSVSYVEHPGFFRRAASLPDLFVFYLQGNTLSAGRNFSPHDRTRRDPPNLYHRRELLSDLPENGPLQFPRSK